MKKVASIVLASTFLISSLGASIFSGYDFTFFKSVSNSIAVMDSEKVGLDYTGYGFLGDMTSGIFLRLGLQSPYTTLLATFDSLKGNDNIDSDLQPTPLKALAELGDSTEEREFTVLFAFGPAFRRFVSKTLSWYLGLGVKIEQDITDISPSISTASRTKIIENSVATDIDIGFRLTAEEHTTLRIGLYLTRPLFILTETKNISNSPVSDNDSEFRFQQNIFTPKGSEIQWEAQGYISLGHTYASFLKPDKYRYVITSDKIFSGTLEKM